MTSIWELPNVYFQNLLLVNNTPENNLQPQMHICPLPCTPFEQKLPESVYFLKTRFLIDANDLNLRVAKCIFSKSTPHQQHTRQQPSTSNAYLSTPMHTLWGKIGWVSIFLKNRFQIDANDLNLRVTKCIFSKSTPRQQYIWKQPSTSNAYLSTPMHTLWAKIAWVSIFFKNQIPNWRKWPQFESCQMYIFKIYSSSTTHQTTTFNLKCIFVHSHAHPLSKNWMGQHIFKKNWSQIDANDLNLRVTKCIFSKSTPHQQYTRKQPTTSNAYLSTPMHILWAKIGWVSIFFKTRFLIDANDLNLRVAKCIFSKSTPHQQHTRQQRSTSNAYLSTPMHTLWAKIGWVSIFLKNWFQIDANDLNLRVTKCIFSKSTPRQQYTWKQPSTSNAYLSTPMHTLWAKIAWVSIFFKNQIPNWRKWPQFESCQMYIFEIYSSSTTHQTTTFNLKRIFVHCHAHPLRKNWLSQHIFKKQIPNWLKWPQFESCQMYIFKIYSWSTIHQTTPLNLKCTCVHSHPHPLSKNWLSQYIF